MATKITVNPRFGHPDEDNGGGGMAQPVTRLKNKSKGPTPTTADGHKQPRASRRFFLAIGIIMVGFSVLVFFATQSATSGSSSSGSDGESPIDISAPTMGLTTPTMGPTTPTMGPTTPTMGPTTPTMGPTTRTLDPTKAPSKLGETKAPTTTIPVTTGNLIWGDNFDGATLDATKWASQTGDGSALGIPGWGNGELQSYNDDNVAVVDGMLKLTIKQTAAHAYTSGKIRTLGKFEFTYGRAEAKIKTPIGAQGVWSAFWMLPTPTTPAGEGLCDIATSNGCGDYGPWASSGEIDILEVANDQKLLTSATHYGGNWPNNVFKSNQTPAPNGGSLNDEFHIYGVEWTPSEIRWYMDGVLYHTQRHWWSMYNDPSGGATENPYPKPFNKPFHLIFNLAVGGQASGYTGNQPEDGDRIRDVPQEMLVDWVKVYDSSDIAEKTPVKCGDFNCDAGETAASCSSDCGTGNPPDPVCGDGTCAAGEFAADCPVDCASAPAPRDPIWQDNFDGATLDATKWASQLGDGTAFGAPGWGNSELQSYEDDNVAVVDGMLKLTVKQIAAHAYTSGKIRTLGKFEFTYGRVEARIKTPVGAQGVWSAFWMLPSPTGLGLLCDVATSNGCGDYGPWPASGEIDILEMANDQKQLTSAIHYGGNWPNNVFKMQTTALPNDGSFHDTFHIYGLEWTPSEIRWYIDGTLYHTQRHYWSMFNEALNGPSRNAFPKPFDKPLHLIFNVAVGGQDSEYTGNKVEDGDRIRDVPQELLVDWVKVYDSMGVAEKTPIKCGDFNCDAGETQASCPSDCTVFNKPDPVCGDGTCGAGEFRAECPADCQ